jgi:hypothetical protein
MYKSQLGNPVNALSIAKCVHSCNEPYFVQPVAGMLRLLQGQMLGSSSTSVDEPPMPGHAEVLLEAMQVCTTCAVQNIQNAGTIKKGRDISKKYSPARIQCRQLPIGKAACLAPTDKTPCRSPWSKKFGP